MILAESMIVWFVGLILLGIFGFFAVGVMLVFQLLAYLFRALTGRGGDDDRQLATAERAGRICPHPRCGNANPRTARFCARCGRPLQHLHSAQTHG